MEIHSAVMLVAAGVFGGMLSSMVGGASLVTFPALLAAGLPPVAAAVSNLVALTPATIIAALADRSQLPPLDRAFVGLIAVSVLGAAAGAALLLLTPERLFQALIPLLLGMATVLFAQSARLSTWLRARARDGGAPRLSVTSVPLLLPVSVYGGYFGAGVGILLLGTLSVATAGDYRAANVTKNVVASFNTAVAVLYFAANDAVWWQAALTMMAGTLLGGFIGGRLARVVAPAFMRVVVVAVGTLLTAVYAWRYWF